jgi:hypothetical protein
VLSCNVETGTCNEVASTQPRSSSVWNTITQVDWRPAKFLRLKILLQRGKYKLQLGTNAVLSPDRKTYVGVLQVAAGRAIRYHVYQFAAQPPYNIVAIARQQLATRMTWWMQEWRCASWLGVIDGMYHIGSTRRCDGELEVQRLSYGELVTGMERV